MIVVIDDERTFKRNAHTHNTPIAYIRSSDDALAFLARLYCDQMMRYAPAIDELWLDHDLGAGDDIRIVVDFLCLTHLNIAATYIHSQNPTIDWMVDSLSNAGYPFVMRTSLPELQPN